MRGLAAGVLLGFSALAVNAEPPPAEPAGFWSGPVNDPVPATIAGGQVIHTRALSELLQQKSVVVVDVSNGPRRPDNLPASSTWLPVPHKAIPGAIWVPGAGMGVVPEALDQYFRERLATATGHDSNRVLVIYCHETCWLSWNAAKRAIGYGYRRVYWYPEGIEGWLKGRFPTSTVESEPVP
jgi:PQQ-dependent catabolism-associated CXXCW motif protein